MDPRWALVSIVVLAVAAVVIGVVTRERSGRRRSATGLIGAEEIGLAELGSAATIVQFSTELCSRCPGVRRSLSALAGRQGDTAFVDVDLTHRPDLSSRFHVLQTPTVLVLDDAGEIRARFGGAVTAQSIASELEAIRNEDRVSV